MLNYALKYLAIFLNSSVWKIFKTSEKSDKNFLIQPRMLY